jgi:arylsulfatase A-like enzyme
MTRLILLVLGLFVTTALAQTPRPARPNVVVVLIDDMGIGDLSCYDKDAAPTPRIDRLAKEGVRFTQYYSSAPICSPSRCAIITGHYPQRHGITSYIDNRGANQRRGMQQWLDVAVPTLPRILHDNGYATAHFGKWHLGGGRDVGEAPLVGEYGYDETLTQFEGLGDRVLGLFDKHDGTKPEKSGLCLASERLGRGKVEWVDRSAETSIFAGRAIAFMDKAVADGKPFFINVWPDDVHSPFFPPKDLRTDEGKRALYRSVVQATDRQLTAMLDHIATTPALRDSTVVILLSDNGPEPGAGTAGVYRGNKGQLYDGGVREPLIVWGPGFVQNAGSTNDTSVIAGMDLAPSILAMAGVKTKAEFDGVNVADTLLGKNQSPRTTPVFWRRPPDRPGPPRESFPDLAMRDGDWKLMCMTDGSEPQLYDLKADPGEKHNLAAEQAERVKTMTKACLDWNAPLPKDNAERPRRGNAGDNNG